MKGVLDYMLELEGLKLPEVPAEEETHPHYFYTYCLVTNKRFVQASLYVVHIEGLLVWEKICKEIPNS
jgi:hypothetical protein